MSETNKLILAIMVTAVVAGSGVYLLQAMKPQVIVEQKPIEILTEQPTASTNQTALTNAYLSSQEWGPENGSLGLFISFKANGTFSQYPQGETDGLIVTGSYTVVDNKVVLKPELTGGLPYDGSVIVPNSMMLEQANDSLFSAEYLAENGRIAYWNRSKNVAEGSLVRYENYILVTNNKNLQPKSQGVAFARPFVYDASYEFLWCDTECSPSSRRIPLSEVFGKAAARTQFKDELNGVNDYWYLVSIERAIYSTFTTIGIRTMEGLPDFVWVHGSNLEMR